MNLRCLLQLHWEIFVVCNVQDLLMEELCSLLLS